MSRLAVLMYHMVASPASPAEVRYACPPTRFERHMRFLRQAGYGVVGLDAVAEAYESGIPLPPRAVAVTIDDGMRDAYAGALPVLERHRIPATLFVTAGLVGQSNRWMEKAGYPRREMASWAELEALAAAGVTIGAHSVNHPRLPELSTADARREIRDSKALLEERLRRPVEYFAYPYGLYAAETVRLVREAGFRLACSTRSGFNRVDADRFTLRRLEVYGTDSVWKLRQKLSFGTNDASLLLPLRYYAGRLSARLGLAR
jgi:peptidoglycan/xylan/chitin deacetylase (PgdA/CDA1 family)